MVKYPFAPKHSVDYLELLCSVVREVLAKKPKVLVLDLDNTLWGGIIGDDGIDGIILGDSSPEAEAYLGFCKYVHNLSIRGVVFGYMQ